MGGSVLLLVREEPASLRDDATVHLDRLDVVVVAEVNLQSKHASKVSGTPPVVRKTIDDEGG